MPSSGSLEKVLKEIDELRKTIQAADIAPNQEYRKTRALGVLDGVEKILKAACMGESGSYYEFTFWQNH